MRELNQGDTYEEFVGDDGLPMDLVDEGAEDTNAKITQIAGIPVKILVFGGVGLLVLIIGLLVFSLRKTDDEETVDDWQSYEDEVEYTPSTESSEIVINVIGEDDTTYLDEEPDLSSLSTEEQITLRKLGYTGDEIALALDNGFDVQGLIDHATELHDAEAHDALVRMSDAASDEFRYILDFSYFGQPGYEFYSFADGMFSEYVYSIEHKIINADYIKCPTYGSQLQLKCHIADDLDIFYVVTPERFASLPERGNIVLDIEYTIYGDNLYVTDVVETDSLLESIDSSTISSSTLYSEAATDSVE